MTMEQLNLAAVVRSAFDITSVNETGYRAQIRLNLELDPAPLRGDRVRLLQVVWNLMSNAVKFTPRGNIDVHLDRDGNDARLSVTDPASHPARLRRRTSSSCTAS